MKTTIAASLLAATTLTGCAATVATDSNGHEPSYSFPVTSNYTPYTECLAQLSELPGENLPTFTVGEILDKTGQRDMESDSMVLTQGVTEMVMSALWETGKVNLVERFDLRIPLADREMVRQGIMPRTYPQGPTVRPANFVVLGALTELNYNIVSQGAGLYVGGAGFGGRSVIINVGLDLRVVNPITFDVPYVTTLQKQIAGYEVEGNVFRFFGDQLVEFDAGRIENEPLQLGVRSVVEMATHQIMTDFLGLPSSPECELAETEFFSETLDRNRPQEN
ncbi:CsgG/HfaB family protein [Fodinicurvata sp. EGI_FJ10296]|uniref:CsgG/HfaB family protein n=1 Tax=Fodinicurvata sp. EGI_FJ10296 TaxID=3231908 RepID=UPI00345384F3